MNFLNKLKHYLSHTFLEQKLEIFFEKYIIYLVIGIISFGLLALLGLFIAVLVSNISCEFHKNEWKLSCVEDRHNEVWYAKNKIYFDAKAQAFVVDDELVPPGGALCKISYED